MLHSPSSFEVYEPLLAGISRCVQENSSTPGELQFMLVLLGIMLLMQRTPAVETHQKAVVFEHPVHLLDRGHEPFVRLVIGNHSAIAGGIPDQIRRVSGD